MQCLVEPYRFIEDCCLRRNCPDDGAANRPIHVTYVTAIIAGGWMPKSRALTGLVHWPDKRPARITNPLYLPMEWPVATPLHFQWHMKLI